MKSRLLVVISIVYCSGSALDDWVKFERAVRDQHISKTEAFGTYASLMTGLFDFADTLPFSSPGSWHFPVVGYSIADVGKGGFLPDIRYGSSPIRGYDFFDGNRHGGHPAYDIFIHDDNRDNVDDRTGKPVEIAAPEDILVLSIDTAWVQGSALRGGNYLWGFSAPDSLLLYFAHLDRVSARSGDFCKAGTVLGTIGRSGANAAAARSPTHLHMMVLKIGRDRPVPVDIWVKLNACSVTNSR